MKFNCSIYYGAAKIQVESSAWHRRFRSCLNLWRGQLADNRSEEEKKSSESYQDPILQYHLPLQSELSEYLC